MFGKQKQISVLIELLDREQKKRISEKQRRREAEKLLSAATDDIDRYCAEAKALKRKLDLSVSSVEKEKLLAENKKLADENGKLKRWVEVLLAMNDTLDAATRKISDEFTRKKLVPLQTQNEAYRLANQKLRAEIERLKGETRE